MAVEHQAFAVPRAFPEPHHIRAPRLDLLPANRKPRRFQRAAHVARHLQLLAGGTRNVDDVRAHGHEFVFANLRQDRLGQILIHGVGFSSQG